MVDIQCAAAEIRRGEKEEKERKKIETTGRKYNGLPHFSPYLIHQIETHK